MSQSGGISGVIHTREVTGSSPVSPIHLSLLFAGACEFRTCGHAIQVKRYLPFYFNCSCVRTSVPEQPAIRWLRLVACDKKYLLLARSRTGPMTICTTRRPTSTAMTSTSSTVFRPVTSTANRLATRTFWRTSSRWRKAIRLSSSGYTSMAR